MRDVLKTDESPWRDDGYSDYLIESALVRQIKRFVGETASMSEHGNYSAD